MNKHQAVGIICLGMTDEGRYLLELEQKHNVKIKSIPLYCLEAIAKSWLRSLSALEAQLDEQGFPKAEAAGSTPA